MLFKTILLISLSICGIYAQTTQPSADAKLKEELLKRAAALDIQIKNGIKMLQSQKREHLSQLLKDEEKRLESLVKDLNETKLTDSGSLAFLENQLIEAEFRVKEELNILEREAATQELVINNARVLKKKIADEVKILETIEDTRKSVAQATIKAFNNESLRVDEIIKNLTSAQDQKTIETLEVELRSIEVRIYITLALVRNLLKPVKTTPHASATPAPTTVPTGTPVVRTTFSPAQIKEFLIKRATQLENGVNAELAKLKAENRTAPVAALLKIEEQVKIIAAKLTKAEEPEILGVIDTELYWLEMRLSIELQAVDSQIKRVDKLLAIAAALKQRIVSVEKTLGQTPVTKRLDAQSVRLDTLSTELKNAKTELVVDNLEVELTSIEKKIFDELNAIGNPTTKAF